MMRDLADDYPLDVVFNQRLDIERGFWPMLR
jgi:hypothetical protein